MIKSYNVIISNQPANVSDKEMAEYILDAIQSWKGQFFPGDWENDPDPLFAWKAGGYVRVKRQPRKPTK